MVDNKQLKEYNLKIFLYNFFIIWNLLIIIILIWLNFYLKDNKILKSKPVYKSTVNGQFKSIWNSKSEFQNIDKDIFFIDVIASNDDKFLDFISISKSGNLNLFNGENGQVIFNINLGGVKSRFGLVDNFITAGNTNGTVQLFSHKGKSLWKDNVNEQIIDICENIILTKKSVFLIDTDANRIKESFKYIKNKVIGNINKGDFNNDGKNDYLISEKNYIHCLDGKTLKQLWSKDIPYIYSGYKGVIYDKNKDIFIIVPLYNGTVKILNKFGTDVFNISLQENLVHEPLVFKNKNYMFIQRTIDNNLYAFDFKMRQNIWSLNFIEKIMDIKSVDIDYDSINEIFVLTEGGKIFIINSMSGEISDFYNSFSDTQGEKVVSNLAISDIDNDNNFEFSFTTDNANIYAFKYVKFNKKFVLKKYIKFIKEKWKLIK